MEPDRNNERHQVAGAEPLDGPSLTAARGWAQTHGIALMAGSISEAVPDTDRAYNTSVLIQPDGSTIPTPPPCSARFSAY